MSPTSVHLFVFIVDARLENNLLFSRRITCSCNANPVVDAQNWWSGHRLSSGSIGWSCPHLVVERCTVHFRSHCKRRTRSNLKERAVRGCVHARPTVHEQALWFAVPMAHEMGVGSPSIGRSSTISGAEDAAERRGCRRGWRGLRALRRFTRWWGSRGRRAAAGSNGRNGGTLHGRNLQQVRHAKPWCFAHEASVAAVFLSWDKMS